MYIKRAECDLVMSVTKKNIAFKVALHRQTKSLVAKEGTGEINQQWILTN